MKLIKTNQPSVYYVQNKNSVSYYYNYKDTITKKSTRKKIFSKDKHLKKYVIECLLRIEDFKEENKQYNNSSLVKNVKFQNFITINKLSEIYFKDRIDTKKRQLREYYNHQSHYEFENNNLVNKKIKSIEGEILKYNKNIGNYLISRININKITKSDIKDYIENNLGKLSLSQKTKHMIISLIKTIINYGIKNEIINTKNPFEYMNFKNPKRKRERVLNEEEIKLLLQECKKHNRDQIKPITYPSGRKVNMTLKKNYNIYLSVYLGVLTASRMGSILNIQKKDINVEEKTITLLNLKSDMKKYKVKLNDFSINWLKEKILPHYDNEEYLIRHTNKDKRLDPPQPMSKIPLEVYKIMDRLFNENINKRNNIERDNVCNFHSIRRSIGTNLVKNGTSVYNVMILLNHTNITQTMDYLNLSHNYLDSDLDNLMGNIFKGF